MEILADVQDDESVTITTAKKRKENLPPYDCIGGNMAYPTKVVGFQDLYSIIQGMSKQTAWLWWELVKTRNRHSNECKYVAESRVDKRRLTIAYKELRKLDLVCRIRKQHYIINPLAYLPEQGQFQAVSSKWEALP
jgi:hypothetical protein